METRNIHVLPTDNPSRLCYDREDNLRFAPNAGFSTADGKQHVYITSDEEIKDCCVLNTHINQVYSLKGYYGFQPLVKKIILTTDQDLIADGVQAIDDEFLEWFVKNPSCEVVEVSYGVLKPFQSIDKGYMIHLPNNEVLEEPKQGCLIHLFSTSGVELIRPRIPPFPYPSELPKQDRTCTNNCSAVCGECQVFKPKQDDYTSQDFLNEISWNKSKQETLEEVAKQYAKTIGNKDGTAEFDFIRGAKWQAERMYSEEEVIRIIQELMNDVHVGDLCYGDNIIDFKLSPRQWFEQHKK
jgi:hypothetical protein